MKVAANYPVNVCLYCGGELKRNFEKKGYDCVECGEFFEDTFLNASTQNIEDPKTMR